MVGIGRACFIPQLVRALPGKKTDREDSQRISRYLQQAFVARQFRTAPEIRQLRELTRRRTHLEGDRNRVINRMGRLLETANVKLGLFTETHAGHPGRSDEGPGPCPTSPRFEEKVATYVRARFPAVSGPDDQRSREFVRESIRIAGTFGLEQEYDLRRFTEFRAEYGENFHLLEWAAAVLNDHTLSEDQPFRVSGSKRTVVGG